MFCNKLQVNFPSLFYRVRKALFAIILSNLLCMLISENRFIKPAIERLLVKILTLIIPEFFFNKYRN